MRNDKLLSLQSALAKREEAQEKAAPEKPPLNALLKKHQRRLEEEARALSDIAQKVVEEGAGEGAERLAAYLLETETNYLARRRLAAYLPPVKKEAEKPGEFCALMKRDEEGGYLLFLPSMMYASNKNHRGAGRHYMGELTRKAMEPFLKDIKAPAKKAHLAFIHHYQRNKTAFLRDADNVDIKSVIDALNGVFFVNDSLAHLSLSQEGRVGKRAYTEVKIDLFTKRGERW